MVFRLGERLYCDPCDVLIFSRLCRALVGLRPTSAGLLLASHEAGREKPLAARVFLSRKFAMRTGSDLFSLFL